jgi:hypothetical protein
MSQSHALSPKWVDQFINIIGIYPVGSLVEFNTGERGIVVVENPLAKTKPMVTIIADSVQRSHFPIDLSLPATDPVRKIIRILDPTKEDVNIGDYIEL